jgi:hypothetical protein
MSDPKLARPSWRGRENVDALTIACIERAEIIGGHEFTVTQGSYQSGGGDINSAGTHDLGGVVDLRWCGHDDCLRALRLAGMAAWHRTPAQGPWVDHIHAVVVGHPRLALSAERQVNAYLTRRDGLKANGPDDGPWLSPIPEPVWPWPPVVDRAAEVRPDLNDAMAATKRAEAKVQGRPRMAFWGKKARQALRKMRQINRRQP